MDGLKLAVLLERGYELGKEAVDWIIKHLPEVLGESTPEVARLRAAFEEADAEERRALLAKEMKSLSLPQLVALAALVSAAAATDASRKRRV